MNKCQSPSVSPLNHQFRLGIPISPTRPWSMNPARNSLLNYHDLPVATPLPVWNLIYYTTRHICIKSAHLCWIVELSRQCRFPGCLRTTWALFGSGLVWGGSQQVRCRILVYITKTRLNSRFFCNFLYLLFLYFLLFLYYFYTSYSYNFSLYWNSNCRCNDPQPACPLTPFAGCSPDYGTLGLTIDKICILTHPAIGLVNRQIRIGRGNRAGQHWILGSQWK